jgi:hypothetical protein
MTIFSEKFDNKKFFKKINFQSEITKEATAFLQKKSQFV